MSSQLKYQVTLRIGERRFEIIVKCKDAEFVSELKEKIIEKLNSESMNLVISAQFP
jgi:hypothetical protein